MRPLLLTLLAVALVSLPGCKNPCIALAEKICDCQKTANERSLCVSRANDEASQRTLTPEDKATCSALVDKCDCHALDTPQGKQACGLAR